MNSNVDSHEEFLDDFGPHTGTFGKAVPSHPASHEEFVDVCQITETEFTIVLNDRMTVTVRGRSIRLIGNNGGSESEFPPTFAINRLSGTEEITVAVFRASEVAGIYQGQKTLLARPA